MIKFTPKSDAEMEMIETYHRQIQGTIAILANKKLSNEPVDDVKGILKYEGGVTVGRCEICIREDHVRDDWVYHNNPSKEEQATVDAINQLLDAIDFSSKEKAVDSLKKFITETLSPRDQVLLERFIQSPFAGDNLMAFFKKMR